MQSMLSPKEDGWFHSDLRLPEHLVRLAAQEREEHGQVLLDTACLLIEAGADMHRIDAVLDEQLELLDATDC